MTLTAAILGFMTYYKFRDRAINLAQTADKLDTDSSSAN